MFPFLNEEIFIVQKIRFIKLKLYFKFNNLMNKTNYCINYLFQNKYKTYKPLAGCNG